MRITALSVVIGLGLGLVGCHDFTEKVEKEEVAPADLSVYGYSKDVLLQELPAVVPESVNKSSIKEYAQATSRSYNEASAKGNDVGSTKKSDLIRWYDEIRHADTTDVFRNFDGSDFVYRQVPMWTPRHQIGVFSKPYAENALDYYNFMRALFGGQRVYMSGYKQAASQASSWSTLSGGHAPTLAMAEALGIAKPLFWSVAFGREAGNLQGGQVNKLVDYAILKQLPRNGDLTSIWNEGSSDGIAGLGHRNSFMHAPGKDVGIGLVEGYHTWMSWGADPRRNDGGGLGGAPQAAIFDAYPLGPVPSGVMMFPSNGYFPFFALGGHNQSVSVKQLNKDFVTGLVKDEVVTLKMEYFVHQDDKDLTTLTQPVKTLVLSDVVGSTMDSGGVNPGSKGKDWVASCKDDTTPCGDGVQDLGGYQFSTGHRLMPLVFRMPYGWYDAIRADMEDAELNDTTPKYHTVRYSFSSQKQDGTAGESLMVKQPFYMNPTVNKTLTLQTTFFDINRQT
ncbi:hypothetical protein [Vibrio jasicida]|uniref:hypothetical protein n=1 Tax=Vibrio jasicida TaxID=766224 RepID=UPI0005ED9BD0|nr:hypothetical protein [Vibrio jasicida]